MEESGHLNEQNMCQKLYQFMMTTKNTKLAEKVENLSINQPGNRVASTQAPVAATGFVQPVCNPTVVQLTPRYPFVVPQTMGNVTMMSQPLQYVPTVNPQFVQGFALQKIPQQPVSNEQLGLQVYRRDYPNSGYCLIISNEKFNDDEQGSERFDDRKGSTKDQVG
jgi:hypothetical protein